MDYSGKQIIVTGGASGIGRATGLAFCESDDIVVYLFRNYGPAASDTFLSPEGLRDAVPAPFEIPMMLRRRDISHLQTYAPPLVRLKCV